MRWWMLVVGLLCVAVSRPAAQSPASPDWPAIEAETMRHFQALLRFDTSDPPGGEKPAADYVKDVLEREGIPVEIFALEAHRPNVVARLKGSGAKRPLLIMGHTDVVNVDPKKWSHPPFGATVATSTGAALSMTRTTSWRHSW
jgi:acetylornithine deacetylase/succinyl-diaminopimelate desuccinylase-like protein